MPLDICTLGGAGSVGEDGLAGAEVGVEAEAAGGGTCITPPAYRDGHVIPAPVIGHRHIPLALGPTWDPEYQRSTSGMSRMRLLSSGSRRSSCGRSWLALKSGSELSTEQENKETTNNIKAVNLTEVG